LIVSLSGAGTENYNLYFAVVNFLNKREMRYSEPDIRVCKERDFVRAILRETGAL
jgi:hypothetical protein